MPDEVVEEADALERIGANPNGPDLTGKGPGSVLQQQIIRKAETISTAKPGQATAPRDLNEQVLWNQVNADPAAGSALQDMNNDLRFPASAGFQKMQALHKLPDGTNINIHYQYNSTTGKTYDMKIVSPQSSALQPGPSKN
jgi:filamentous hemagglutinin